MLPTPLPAASVLVMREPYQVLMLRRHEKSSFVPNAWVFPGGIAEPSDYELAREWLDGSELNAMRIAGIRETFEETGVWLGDAPPDGGRVRERLLKGEISLRDLVASSPPDVERLVWTSRWITPVGVPKRFDTYFFIARVAPGTSATAEQNEIVEVRWITPSDALAAHAGGSMHMIFPTVRNLEAIAPFSSIDELAATRRNASIEPVQPVLVNGKPTLP